MVNFVKKIAQLCAFLILVFSFPVGDLFAQQTSSLSQVKISGPTNTADSLALVELFNTADGIKWTNKDGWLYLAVPAWHGVSVNGSGRVTGVELPFNELEGEIPFEIGDLSELRTLDLSDNFTRGVDLPESIAYLSKLQTFKLSGLQELSSGIFELGDLRELVLAVISTNRIPEGLGRLSQLRGLNIYTQAQGPIPNDLGNLRNLENLRFTARWSGQIPDSFWNMTKLKTLRIRGTQRSLDGGLSSSIGNLRDLELLSITNTNLSGAIPSEIGNLQNLNTIELSSNKFTSLPSELTRLNRLKDFDMDDNNLSDTIPLEMARFMVDIENRGACRLDNNEASFCLPNTSEYQALGRDPICRIRLSNSCTAIVTGPQAPTLSAPNNGASGLSTQVTFTWNVADGAQNYQLEVSERSDFQNTAFSLGGLSQTTHTIPSNTLSNDQRYHWRVRASNSQGNSYSETRSFTTEAARVLPGVPGLISPSNNSGGLNLPVTLSWQASLNADLHVMQVSKQSNFSTREFESDINGSSRELNGNDLEEGETYYWRVKGRNGNGDSAWSDVWKFTTVTAPVLPGVARLISPSNNSGSLNIPVTFSWQASSNADLHVMQVSKQSNFSSREFESDINGSSRELNGNDLEEGETYYWRVKGRNSVGESSWSDVWKFTTVRTPVLPSRANLVSPSNNSTELDLPVTFSWETSLNANLHVMQVSKQSSFSTLVFDSNVNTNSRVLTRNNLEEGETYYWRVKGRNNVGDSPWSETWKFATSRGPVFPASSQLISPSNNSTDQSIPLTFSWRAFTDADVYLLQVSKVASFATRVFDSPEINARSYGLDENHLEEGQTYFWRVKGRNSDGDSPWSDVWTFSSLQRQYLITIDVGQGGSISVADSSYVNHGEIFSFSIRADQGFDVADVLVDNVSQGSIDRYTFQNVMAEHSVAVKFAIEVNNENEVPGDLAGIEIYPNPVRSVLHFKTDGLRISSLKIYDSLGREAYSFTESVKNLDVSALPVGVYHVEIIDESGDRVLRTIAKVK